jgi:hypothetical protein
MLNCFIDLSVKAIPGLFPKTKRRILLLPGCLALCWILATSMPVLAQKTTPMEPRTVTGKVLDENGKGIAGATIQVKGTTIGTTTGDDGSFSIQAPKGKSSMVVSYIGFEKQEVIVGATTNFSITMISATRSLSDVVVIGYGTQSKRDVTGPSLLLMPENSKNALSSGSTRPW